MSLLALLYHRAQAGPAGNAPQLLDDHFALIAHHYGSVLPGERLSSGRLNVCLTFDDAYFDFYAIVFPLLKKHRLRALLAVAPAVIGERTETTAVARLHAPAEFESARPEGGAFCLWSELREMAESGFVTIAAHGYSHCRLDRDGVDFSAEIAMPQTLLSGRVGQPVSSFVFPYGRFSCAALRQVRQLYPHAFRIGGADNRDWNGSVLYRVNADNLTAPDEVFRPSRLPLYRARRFWNQLRGR